MTRADLIRTARLIAAERGMAAPRLSFVRDDSQAWLHADCGSEVIRLDGSGQVIHDLDEPDDLAAAPR